MLNYVRLDLSTSLSLPSITSFAPFRAVVIIECDASSQQRDQISTWLVNSGCRYMMAWGNDCSSWDDAVDFANLEQFDFSDIPQDQFVMTTWHENESIEQVLWFAKKCAFHSTVEIQNTLIIHLSETDQSLKLKKIYDSL